MEENQEFLQDIAHRKEKAIELLRRKALSHTPIL